MKRFCLVLVLLVSMTASSFAGSEIVGIRIPDTKTEKALYITTSLILIYAGTRTMVNSNNDLVVNLTGAAVTFGGATGLYMTLFEW